MKEKIKKSNIQRLYTYDGKGISTKVKSLIDGKKYIISTAPTGSTWELAVFSHNIFGIYNIFKPLTVHHSQTFEEAEKKHFELEEMVSKLPQEKWACLAMARKLEKQDKIIASNPKFGHIICRCEKVSEAEVLEAVRRGAHTLDSVKHVTRAGMGRCQSGFCGPIVLGLLSRELGIPVGEVTKKGDGSFLVLGKRRISV